MKVPEANQAPQTFAQVFAEPGQLCHDERTSHKLTKRSRKGHQWTVRACPVTDWFKFCARANPGEVA